uniref:Large ribosomal subunit protein bL33c n=1 Tax=Dictyopteris divaricata TaxID=156996 RepID=A0A2I4Q2E6_9PHAE|nr:50S ribosomal protein L33 [Dictyopteris divaricata]YP_010205309.1 50S ribosomal protein L33 [Grateloupia livida]AQZ25021.1 50S ribosomal protein L33 [Dictyopteris divaricata]UAV85878.1 50S ribosomal protein L33 [Grateloupia livida]
MAKAKDIRIIITLKCTECNKNKSDKIQSKRKQITYSTTKNRRNTPERLELKKFCPNCNSHTLQKELK